MASISTLPDELLLAIGSHFQGRSRNRDLANLSLASRRFRAVGQETLLCTPSFHLTYIHEFLWELGHHPTFVPKIRRLEIKSSSRGRCLPDEDDDGDFQYTAVRCPPALLEHKEFVLKSTRIMQHYAKSKIHALLWAAALKADVVQALLGVLLVILPNLKELYLGGSWLMDFPIFRTMFSSEVRRHRPSAWSHGFLAGVLDTLKPKLEVLEFPADMDGLTFTRSARAIFDFRCFEKLRYLSVPMEVLFWCDTHRAGPAHPTTVLPASLQLLRISECTEATANFVNELCLSKKKDCFPLLRRVELYFEGSLRIMAHCATAGHHPHPVHDVREMCMDAGLELYLYFPEHWLITSEIGDTPWSFQEENQLMDAERRIYPSKGRPSFEFCFDGQGDVEMRDARN